jgi:hypothetical protein
MNPDGVYHGGSTPEGEQPPIPPLFQQDVLPPDIVARIDQRVAACSDNLDRLIAVYRELTQSLGTAGAQGQLAISFTYQYTSGPKALGGLRDILIAAIARLADAS